MENTKNIQPADNGPRSVPFEPRKWNVIKNEKTANNAERSVVTNPAGGMSEVLMVGDWTWDWSFTTSPLFTLKKNTDYVFTFWLNGGENEQNTENCQFRIHNNSLWDDYNPFTYKLNRQYIKHTKHVAGWYRYDIPFNTGDGDGDGDIIIKQFQFISQYAHSAFMPHLPAFDALPDEPLPDPRIPQRHNIKFAGGYPRDSHWSHLVYGETAQPKPAPNNYHFLHDLANTDADMNEVLEHLNPDAIVDLIRTFGLGELQNMGVDITALLEHVDEDAMEALITGK